MTTRWLGMTTANMKLVMLGVTFPDKLESHSPKLEAGEHIVTRVVELAKLADELNGMDAHNKTVTP